MKKGFTLVEVISIIVIIGVIALITTPVLINLIKSSKEKAYEKTIMSIEQAAGNYSLYNDLGYTKSYKTLSLSEIQSKGYLESDDIIDPRNDSVLEGCVVYRWITETNQYEFEYKADCDANLYPELVISIKNDNGKEWMDEKIQFELDDSYELYKYCIGDNDCIPNEDYIRTTTVDEVGRNIYICVTGYYGEEAVASACTKAYKVDDTAPELIVNSINTTSNKIIVDASCSDEVSGVKGLEYSINNGPYQSENIFSNLSYGSYEVKIKCTNGSGIEEIASETKQTSSIINPVIAQLSQTPSSGEYARERVIRITYNGVGIESPRYYYSLDGSNWESVSGSVKDVTFTSNGYLYAKTVDESGNTSNAATYTVVNTSSVPPTVPVITGGSNDWINTSRTIEVSTPSTELSGIKTYQYYISTSDTSQTGGLWTNGSSVTVSTNGTRYVYFRAIANNGLTSEISSYQVTKVDTENPSCSFSGENIAWTNSSKTITATCSDNLSGCTTSTASKLWTYNSGETSTANLSYIITDNALNSTTCSKVANVYVDKTAPTTPTGGAIGSVSGSSTTGSIQTSASGSTDTGSGNITYKYLVTNNSIAPANTDTRFTTAKTFARSCGTSYYAWAIAEDQAGNRSSVKYLGTTSDGVNSYSAWSACSKTCGGGIQTRTNTCALITTGLNQSCNTQNCSYAAIQQQITTTCTGQKNMCRKWNEYPDAARCYGGTLIEYERGECPGNGIWSGCWSQGDPNDSSDGYCDGCNYYEVVGTETYDYECQKTIYVCPNGGTLSGTTCVF